MSGSVASTAPLELALGGVRFANPVWVGSSELTMSAEGMGVLAAAGAGAVVAKSVNESVAARRQLGIADYAFLTAGWAREPEGRAAGSSALLNRSGLAAHDRDAWLSVLRAGREAAERHGSVLIGSVVVGDPSAVPALVRDIGGVTGHVELNIGAPHGREVASGAVRQLGAGDAVAPLVARARRACPGLLLVKLGDVGPAIPDVVAAAADGGADAVVLTGRQNGFLPDVETLDPVLGSWGAYSAPASLPVSLYAVSKTFRADPGAPIVGTNGARSGDDVFRFLLSGAVATEVVTSVWLEGPEAVSRIVRELGARVATAPVSSAPEAVGVSVRRARDYADIEPGSGRPWEAWGVGTPPTHG